MKTKWYFGALLILFISLGVYQNKISEPNQEIVLKFLDSGITSEEAQNAVVIVKAQLQEIGINTFQVKELKDGQLKISYFSNADIESIKKVLLKDSKIDVDYAYNNQHDSKSPSNKKSKNYKLDVFEIHKSNDSESGLNGKFVLNLKQDYDRFFNPKVYIFNNKVNTGLNIKNVKKELKILANIAIAIDNYSRNMPEVRAGPAVI